MNINVLKILLGIVLALCLRIECNLTTANSTDPFLKGSCFQMEDTLAGHCHTVPVYRENNAPTAAMCHW